MTQAAARQQAPPSDTQLAVQAAGVLATAATAAGAAAALASWFAAAGIETSALRRALDVVMGMPPDRAGFHGPAGAQAARLNLIRRAQFAVASARRLAADAVREAAGMGGPETLAGQMNRERRYYGQHLEAMWNRARAAEQSDLAAADYGLLLGWYTHRDARTSPECLAADRRNFRVDKMPQIGFPGGVHLHCRCSPGPPFAGAPVVGERAGVLRAAFRKRG